MKMLFAVVTCLPVIAGAAILYGAVKAPDSAELDRELKSSIQQRAAWAREALEAQNAACESGTVTLDCLLHAANQCVEAEVEAAPTETQKLAALEKHLEFTQGLDQKISALYKTGSRGGEANAYRTIKREVENAKIMLLKAQIEAK